MIKNKIILISIILSILLSGCTYKVNSGKSQVYNTASVTSGRLLEGDAKKLEPHLDMMTGCVNINYMGDKKSICTKYELWEKGVITNQGNGVSSFIDNNRFDGYISLSMKPDNYDKERLSMKFAICENTGYVASSMGLSKFDSSYSYGPTAHTVDTNIKDTDEMAIWGVTAEQDGQFDSGVDMYDDIKNSDWGFVVKVYFK